MKYCEMKVNVYIGEYNFSYIYKMEAQSLQEAEKKMNGWVTALNSKDDSFRFKGDCPVITCDTVRKEDGYGIKRE